MAATNNSTGKKSGGKGDSKKKEATKGKKKPKRQQKLRARLDFISKEIDRAARKAKKAGASTEKEYARVIGDLQLRAAQLQQELGTLLGKGEAAFDDLKEGLITSASEIDKAIRQAIDRFSKKSK